MIKIKNNEDYERLLELERQGVNIFSKEFQEGIEFAKKVNNDH